MPNETTPWILFRSHPTSLTPFLTQGTSEFSLETDFRGPNTNNRLVISLISLTKIFFVYLETALCNILQLSGTIYSVSTLEDFLVPL